MTTRHDHCDREQTDQLVVATGTAGRAAVTGSSWWMAERHDLYFPRTDVPTDVGETADFLAHDADLHVSVHLV
ncbi:hypothetical protein BaRGS_00004844 [Batillaria attramentaria]|uniref:Uncharacterized protein n=1 Tax=Batillaria attramentaria TaxID=370345 RepID=A0ABD0LX12_9CAEN